MKVVSVQGSDPVLVWDPSVVGAGIMALVVVLSSWEVPEGAETVVEESLVDSLPGNLVVLV